MDLPNLVIVRLNELHYTNKAAPGALLEAVSFRLDRDKPTWVISDSDRPFTSASFAWSESVVELLGTGFTKTVIPRIMPKVIIGESFMADLLPSQISPEASSSPYGGREETEGPQPIFDKKAPSKVRKKPEKGVPGSLETKNSLSMYGSGLDKPKFGGGR